MYNLRIILILVVTLFTFSMLVAQDTAIEIEEMPVREVFIDSTTANNDADTMHIEEIISDTKDQPLYDYNQLFMFGFLILGAILVVWKFSGKGNY